MLKLIRQFLKTKEEFIRYLIVGGWNTLFGICFYTILWRLFDKNCHYLILAVFANIVGITNAYVCYKNFVFKTKGNVLNEYLKCYLVYGVAAGMTMFLLWILVSMMGISPDIGNIFATLIVTTVSYFGHKSFSFARRE